MEEDKGTTDAALKSISWRMISNAVMLVFFVITIALLIYIVWLYYPLKEQLIKDCYNNVNPNITGWVNLTLNATP